MDELRRRVVESKDAKLAAVLADTEREQNFEETA